MHEAWAMRPADILGLDVSSAACSGNDGQIAWLVVLAGSDKGVDIFQMPLDQVASDDNDMVERQKIHQCWGIRS